MNRIKAVSTLEYMILIVFLIGALLVFQKYIVRAFAGGWRKGGDAVGFGKQYDPRSFADGGTDACFNFRVYGVWVDERCFRSNVLCDCTRKLSGLLDPDCDMCVNACRCSIPP